MRRAALLRQVADRLGGLQHEQREPAQEAGVRVTRNRSGALIPPHPAARMAAPSTTQTQAAAARTRPAAPLGTCALLAFTRSPPPLRGADRRRPGACPRGAARPGR